MSQPDDEDADAVEAAFLVERYVSPTATAELAAAVGRLAALCRAPGGQPGGSRVTYLHSTYLAGDDTCFCLFTAASAEAVALINRQARFALDRITSAAVLHPRPNRTPPNQEER